MGKSTIGSDFAKSATGNVETALLTIYDFSKATHERELNRPRPKTTLGSTVPKPKARDDMALQNTRKKLEGQDIPPKSPKCVRKKFYVQFNPSELTLFSSMQVTKKTDQNSRNSRSATVERPVLTLSVPLVFDDVNNTDAFLLERYSSVRNLLETGANCAMKNVHTVQPQVEAFVSAIRNTYTREISFEWGDFSFYGVLSHVQAQYTMFSPSGRPIRANVNLRLNHTMDRDKLDMWYKDFEDLFQTDSSTLLNQDQKMGTMLNLNR